MEDQTFKELKKHISETYVSQAIDARKGQTKLFLELITKRKCPLKGWKNSSIELLLNELSLMDSNNFSHNAGVGEREARMYSDLVSRRHYGFGHGIGRSGELTEVQPKAAGSSLIYKLTNSMMLHIIKLSGIRNCSDCILVPMATGMSLVLCLMTIRKERPNAKYVLWPRIDQKSCFKCIITSGYQPIIIENVLQEDELRTDTDNIELKIKELGRENIAAILTTTSCFAPRGIDKIEEVARLCKMYEIPHIINNAYGLQSKKCSHMINLAAKNGRIDAFVQSTDKNILVPVGGSVIAGFDQNFIKNVSKTYPGRASGSSVLDAFITMLSMGVEGYTKLLENRIHHKKRLEEELKSIARAFELRVLKTPNNQISIAMTLPKVLSDITRLGSMLFVRGISGTRVLDGKETKVIEGYTFKGWGTHTNECSSPYLTAAAAIGMTDTDIDVFIKKLRQCLTKILVSTSVPHLAASPHIEVPKEESDEIENLEVPKEESDDIENLEVPTEEATDEESRSYSERESRNNNVTKNKKN